MNDMRRLVNELEERREEVRVLSREKIDLQNKVNKLENANKALQHEIDNLNAELRAYRNGWNYH